MDESGTPTSAQKKGKISDIFFSDDDDNNDSDSGSKNHQLQHDSSLAPAAVTVTASAAAETSHQTNNKNKFTDESQQQQQQQHNDDNDTDALDADEDDDDYYVPPVEPIVVHVDVGTSFSPSSSPSSSSSSSSTSSAPPPRQAGNKGKFLDYTYDMSYLPPVVPSSAWVPPALPIPSSLLASSSSCSQDDDDDDLGDGKKEEQESASFQQKKKQNRNRPTRHTNRSEFTADDAVRLAVAATDPGVGYPRSMFISANGSALHQRRRVLGAAVTLRGCVVCQDAILRGDISRIQLGKYVLVGSGAVIRPPMMAMRHGMEPPPLVTVGDYGYIGADSVVESSSVGSCVVIERDCILGARSTVCDGVWLLTKSVVPPDATLTTFGVYGGNPATLVGQLHPEAGLFQVRDLIINVIRATGVL